MVVIFCRSDLPGSWLIRAFTRSKWSHCAIINGELAIEATWPRVRLTTLESIVKSHSAYEIRRISTPCDIIAWSYAFSQIGKKYDLGFLFGWLFKDRNWQDPSKWACSELLGACIVAAGRAIRGKTWFTPKSLYEMSESL